jgi:methyl-accepting chemotaxis protein
MQEIMGAVKRVTETVDSITTASQEQSMGIDQVNQAMAQIDRVTQQNAALVEEAAAAAESLQEHAATLVSAVVAFKLDQAAPAAKPAAPAVPAPRPAARPAATDAPTAPKSEGLTAERAERAAVAPEIIARARPAHLPRAGGNGEWKEL